MSGVMRDVVIQGFSSGREGVTKKGEIDMSGKTGIRALAWILILVMAFPPWVFAEPAADPTLGQTDQPAQVLFSQEELDQMLAPIALYPDSLLVQMLMAATYPMEVVSADRWIGANKGLTGDQLATALEQQPWDPSVKSLVNFPSVLGMMDQKLDWTQRLGDAFLSQQDQVMATIQKLRAAAQTQGTLQTTAQQRVITQGQTIVIEPVNPQVVYVPAYDPGVVYGPWWYPAYPPYPYYPVGAVIAGAAIGFGLAVAVGAAWGYAWGGFDWGRRHTTFNVYQNNYYNRHINRNVYAHQFGGGGHGAWHHDPGHRQGVAYRDHGMAQRYGQTARGNPAGRHDFRGQGPGGAHMGGARGPGAGGHPGVQGPRGTPGSQGVRGPGSRQAAGQGRAPGALEGVNRGGRDARVQGDRGRTSRQTMTGSRPGGGAAAPRTVSRAPGGGAARGPGGGGAVRGPGGGGGGAARGPGGGGGAARGPGGGGAGGGGGGGGHRK
jgi:hypothetical protein